MSIYLISKNKDKHFKYNIPVGDFYLNYSDQLKFTHFNSMLSDASIYILGYCIDSRAEINRESIAEHLCSVLDKCSNNWSGFIKETARLAGDFVIVVHCSDYFRVINDATGRLGIYYSNKVMACSSSDALLAQHIGATLNPVAKKIREAATGDGQPLPNDITDFKDIYISLPNFYLDIGTGASKRYFPDENFNNHQSDLSVNECLERSYNLIKNIVRAYEEDCELICPVTAGWDSRVTYSFLNKQNLKTFTLMLPNFTNDTPDIYTPKKYLESINRHNILYTSEPSLESHQKVKSITTPFPGRGALRFATSILNHYDKPVIVSGDIIDQIGSSLIGNDLPDFFARHSFLKCKIHNYSNESTVELKEWMRSASNSRVSLFDLFAWESRLGRWAHDKNRISSSLGVKSANIYNCREVLELWLKIPRKERASMAIHKYYFNRNNPSLLDIPFNPEDRLGNLKNTKFTFVLATYIKHIIDYIKKYIIKKKT